MYLFGCCFGDTSQSSLHLRNHYDKIDIDEIEVDNILGAKTNPFSDLPGFQFDHENDTNFASNECFINFVNQSNEEIIDGSTRSVTGSELFADE